MNRRAIITLTLKLLVSKDLKAESIEKDLAITIRCESYDAVEFSENQETRPILKTLTFSDIIIFGIYIHRTLRNSEVTEKCKNSTDYYNDSMSRSGRFKSFDATEDFLSSLVHPSLLGYYCYNQYEADTDSIGKGLPQFMTSYNSLYHFEGVRSSLDFMEERYEHFILKYTDPGRGMEILSGRCTVKQ